MTRPKPYRAAPLPPNPTLPDYAVHAFASESAHLAALRRISASELDRAYAAALEIWRGKLALAADRLALAEHELDTALACDWSTPALESAYARVVRAGLARDRAISDRPDPIPSEISDRAYLQVITEDSRESSIAERQDQKERDLARRAACGLGNAGLQAKSGTALRDAVGYCYRTDTHASKYAPTTRVNGAVPPADRLARYVERGEYSGHDLDRSVQISAECGDQATAETRMDLPWVVRAKVEINGSVAHASGLDITRSIKAAARNAIRANARIARLKSSRLA